MPSPQRRELELWYRQAEQALSARDYPRAHQLCMSILASAPDFADAIFLLGVIALEHRNFGKAAEVLERAIRLDASQPRYYAQLARCLLALSRPRPALEAAGKALSLQPEDALTLDTIGVVMTRTGSHAQALQAFERAVAREPDIPAYLYNLGTSLQFSGRFTEAEHALRRVLQLDASSFRTWTALAQIAGRPFAPADVQRLTRALEQALSADAQLHLCHALAKHHEELQQYATAFQLLLRGKQAKRATLQYSSEFDAKLFAAARLSFTSAPVLGHESREPIFIVGLPRTGTTLIEQILAAHPQMFAAGELTNFALAVKRTARTPSNLVLDTATLTAPGLDFQRIGADYVASTRPRTGHTTHFIDKMPLNFFFAGMIRRALPNAKIICVRRHPLDTCLANYRQLFATDFPYYNYAYDLLDTGRYYVQFDALIQHWRASLGENFCEVRYEVVVEDTEREARRLLEFCGLPWDAACLHFHRNRQPVATASTVQVRQPIYTSSIDRWRKYETELTELRRLLAENSTAPVP